MTTLYCSQKARAVFGLRASDLDEPDDDVLSTWFAHAVTIDRRKCVLFTHQASLYSFWIAPFRKAMMPDLQTLFRQHLLDTLRQDDLDDETADHLLGSPGFCFAPAADRSTMSSINVHVLDSRAHFDVDDGLSASNVRRVSHRLNHTPKQSVRFAGRFAFPVDALTRLLAQRPKS